MIKALKLLIVIIGSTLVGLGIAIAITCGFGADPITVLWDGISRVLPITVGQASMILAVLMLSAVFILDKKQINIGTVVNPFVVGLSTDFFVGFNINSDSFIINIILLLLGLVILGFGLALYASADFGRGSYEALILAVVKKSKVKLVYVRYCFDFVFLIIGLVLGAKLSIGPVVAFLGLGYVIQAFMSMFEKSNIFAQISRT
ncbi:MAG: hypothetical protein Q4F66_14525 [Clostridium sp.]|nr:hypothetical protein [Clostridium sp.]